MRKQLLVLQKHLFVKTTFSKQYIQMRAKYFREEINEMLVLLSDSGEYIRRDEMRWAENSLYGVDLVERFKINLWPLRSAPKTGRFPLLTCFPSPLNWNTQR